MTRRFGSFHAILIASVLAFAPGLLCAYAQSTDPKPARSDDSKVGQQSNDAAQPPDSKAGDTAPVSVTNTKPVDPKALAQRGPITTEQRLMLIRGLQAEFVFLKRTFPMGQKGLMVKNGDVSPDEKVIRQLSADHGIAGRVGDKAQITSIELRDSSIVFEINGGPVKKTKWYQRIQVGGMGGMTSIAPPPDGVARGSLVTLAFDKHLPSLSPEEVKTLLAPVFDFHAKSAAEAYAETLPPKVREALKDHRVLVGMNKELVNMAKGHAPQQRLREKDDKGVDYEEWIFGQPPQDVEFVRFVGDEVVRLEEMKVSGEKIVKTEKEVDMKDVVAHNRAPQQPGADNASAQPSQDASAAPSATAGPVKRPTLRRPGEAAPQEPGVYTAPPPKPSADPKNAPSTAPSGPQ